MTSFFGFDPIPYNSADLNIPKHTEWVNGETWIFDLVGLLLRPQFQDFNLTYLLVSMHEADEFVFEFVELFFSIPAQNT